MSGYRVLVVDDEPLVLKSVQFALMRSGYVVDAASSADQALLKLESAMYDLVVTDWKMPLMNGDQLARAVRAVRPSLPVLLLTGSVMEKPPPGFDGVLFKPFSVHDLRAAVTALAEQSQVAFAS